MKDKIRRAGLLGILLLTVFACRSGQKAELAMPTVSIEEGEVVTALQQMYADVFTSYLNKATDSEVRYKDCYYFDSLYCSASYKALEAEAFKLFADDGLGPIDYDHWYMGQDYSNDVNCRVQSVNVISATSAEADVVIHNFTNETEVKLSLVKEDGRWLIDDFTGPWGFSEKEEYRRYVRLGPDKYFESND